MTSPPFNYAEVGATRGALPPGYRQLRYRSAVGAGRTAFEVAGEAVLTWRMQRTFGVRVSASAARAEPGVLVRSGLGVGRLRIPAPCRVVWTVDQPGTIGYAYGTLAGHPLAGEEAFLVEHAGDDRVWLRIVSFSRPVTWFARAAGPVTVLLQHGYARGCGWALRRIIG